jgi:hypothetical protein
LATRDNTIEKSGDFYFFQNFKKIWQLENQKSTIFLAILKINLAEKKVELLLSLLFIILV